MTEIEANISWTIGQDEIDRRVKHMGKELAARWPEGKPIDMVAILDSGLFFANDLIRAIQAARCDIAINLHTVKCSVCPSGKQGELQLTGLPTYLGDHDLHILLVDVLMNTGKVQNYVAKHVIGAFDPTLFETCVLLLSDRTRTEWPSEICYFGFKVSEAPMVGYGLGCDFHRVEQGVRLLGQPTDTEQAEPGTVTGISIDEADAVARAGEPTAGPPSEPDSGPEEPGAEPAEPGAEPAEADQEADTPPTDA